VRLSYQDYSAENASHEVTLRTDATGHAIFERRTEKASLFQRIFYTATSAMAFVHASFGRHAHVFAFGHGYEGEALMGKYLVDWTGTPNVMQSRIIAHHTRY
jgi:hypothetical protein